MSEIKLTIGMPAFEDYQGVVATIQSLRLHHPAISYVEEHKLREDVEIIVVDNTIDNPLKQQFHARETENYIKNCNDKNIRYLRMNEQHGPAAVKNKVFKKARGKFVICIDSHVMFPLGVFDKLFEWMDTHPNSKDLITGPLLYNDGSINSHFSPRWRGGMWGVWANDSNVKQNQQFTIWGTGCGLLGCYRDAWLGFNEHFIGFGGEEGYIHEKYRKTGHNAFCLPWLEWWHRFGTPEPRRYHNTKYSKVRNYVIGFNELEKDLKEIHSHFVSTDIPDKMLIEHLIEEHSADTKAVQNKSLNQLKILHQQYKIPQEHWDYLIESPIERDTPPYDQATELMTHFSKQKSDINQHFSYLKWLAEQVQNVTEVTRRRSTSVAFMAGEPATLKSFNYEEPPIEWKDNHKTDYDVEFSDKYNEEIEIPETDLLFVKWPHDPVTVERDLKAWTPKVKRWFAYHDSQFNYRDKIIKAVEKFINENPEWFVYSHHNFQYGLTVLGRNPEDKPEDEIKAWPPGYGPGTELKKLLGELGINAGPNCGCNSRALEMDLWGVSGCERHFDTIVGWLQAGSEIWLTKALQGEDEKKHVTWSERLRKKVSIAGKAIMSGVAFKLDPLNPYPGLVTESIKRAKENDDQ